jgi:segregation and condensation protein B
MSRLSNTIEAILYLKAQPLKLAQLAEFARCDKDSAAEGLIELMSEYAHREGALEIAETEEGYALQLREIYKPLVDTIVPLDIGLGALRTLAAIALRGPITQSELVDLRGSGVYQHVPDLVEQGFIKKRRQSDGRSSWLQITEKFYQHFEIDKLPEISNLRLPKPLEGGSAQAELDPQRDPQIDLPLEDSLLAAPALNPPLDLPLDPPLDLPLDLSVAPEMVESEADGDLSETSAEEIAVLSGEAEPSGGSLLSDEAIEEAMGQAVEGE